MKTNITTLYITQEENETLVGLLENQKAEHIMEVKATHRKEDKAYHENCVDEIDALIHRLK